MLRGESTPATAVTALMSREPRAEDGAWQV
jgi:hypothetical protein